MKSCSKCGTLFDSRHCNSCARVAVAKYRLEHPDKVKESEAKRYIKRRESMKEYLKKYRASRPEGEAYARTLAWRLANPSALRIQSENRRFRKDGGKLSRGLAEKLFRLQRGRCACCGLPLGKRYHLDHVMPLALGGKNEDKNIQLLRQRCNSQKKAKHPIDFMRSRGFLL